MAITLGHHSTEMVMRKRHHKYQSPHKYYQQYILDIQLYCYNRLILSLTNYKSVLKGLKYRFATINLPTVQYAL